MKTVLLINDDPPIRKLKSAFQDAGIPLNLLIARDSTEARTYLAQAVEIDAVLMDYDLGESESSVESDLVQDFVQAGFGVGKKPLVATSVSTTANRQLMEAGCSHKGGWFELGKLIYKLFPKN